MWDGLVHVALSESWRCKSATRRGLIAEPLTGSKPESRVCSCQPGRLPGCQLEPASSGPVIGRCPGYVRCDPSAHTDAHLCAPGHTPHAARQPARAPQVHKRVAVQRGPTANGGVAAAAVKSRPAVEVPALLLHTRPGPVDREVCKCSGVLRQGMYLHGASSMADRLRPATPTARPPALVQGRAMPCHAHSGASFLSRQGNKASLASDCLCPCRTRSSPWLSDARPCVCV